MYEYLIKLGFVTIVSLCYNGDGSLEWSSDSEVSISANNLVRLGLTKKN